MSANIKQCLLFSLCNELFGIDVQSVLRVINFDSLMKVPKAPEYISGAITHEGNVIPVVDMAKKIDLGATAINEKTKIVILQIVTESDTTAVGILIDDVLDVTPVDKSNLLPPALEGIGFQTDIIDGIHKEAERFYTIINAVRLFEKELVFTA